MLVTTTRHSPVHELREELVGEGDGELCEDGFELFETNEAVEVPVHGHEHALDVRVVLAHLKQQHFQANYSSLKTKIDVDLIGLLNILHIENNVYNLASE